MIDLTDKPIDVQNVIEAVSRPEAGAVNVFIGTIRNTANGKAVQRLDYEAYESMAVAEIQKIIDIANRQWGLLRWAVVHRIGIVAPGEVAVVVAVAAPHRKESFAACEYIIDEIKAKVPIWKKEIVEDGSEWV